MPRQCHLALPSLCNGQIRSIPSLPASKQPSKADNTAAPRISTVTASAEAGRLLRGTYHGIPRPALPAVSPAHIEAARSNQLRLSVLLQACHQWGRTNTILSSPRAVNRISSGTFLGVVPSKEQARKWNTSTHRRPGTSR